QGGLWCQSGAAESRPESPLQSFGLPFPPVPALPIRGIRGLTRPNPGTCQETVSLGVPMETLLLRPPLLLIGLSCWESCGEPSECNLLMCCCCGSCYHGSCLEPVILSVLTSSLCVCVRLRGDEGLLLVCQRCDKAYHTHCLSPPLDGTSNSAWTCKVRKSLLGTTAQVCCF
uniref:Zinc finger PHD-type domain-containing protein n=1 Tax=Poecilia latipinna TaxID=48699 RepID=A0A3B3UPD3_9TELE